MPTPTDLDPIVLDDELPPVLDDGDHGGAPGGRDDGGGGDDGDDDDDGDDGEHLSAAARWVGSEQSMVWFKRVTMGVALAFLVGAVGYLVGVKTTVPPANAVDQGFLADMSDHHDQAVRMAQTAVQRATDPVVQSFAKEVILFQRQELGQMYAYQQQHGDPAVEYRPDRPTMAWMGMNTPLERMPGMASAEQLDKLEHATGVDVDKQFLELMINHHQGGVHMAEYAAASAGDPHVRDLAGLMARNQAVEAREYQSVLNRINGTR